MSSGSSLQTPSPPSPGRPKPVWNRVDRQPQKSNKPRQRDLAKMRFVPNGAGYKFDTKTRPGGRGFASALGKYAWLSMMYTNQTRYGLVIGGGKYNYKEEMPSLEKGLGIFAIKLLTNPAAIISGVLAGLHYTAHSLSEWLVSKNTYINSQHKKDTSWYRQLGGYAASSLNWLVVKRIKLLTYGVAFAWSQTGGKLGGLINRFQRQAMNNDKEEYHKDRLKEEYERRFPQNERSTASLDGYIKANYVKDNSRSKTKRFFYGAGAVLLGGISWVLFLLPVISPLMKWTPVKKFFELFKNLGKWIDKKTSAHLEGRDADSGLKAAGLYSIKRLGYAIKVGAIAFGSLAAIFVTSTLSSIGRSIGGWVKSKLPKSKEAKGQRNPVFETIKPTVPALRSPAPPAPSVIERSSSASYIDRGVLPGLSSRNRSSSVPISRPRVPTDETIESVDEWQPDDDNTEAQTNSLVEGFKADWAELKRSFGYNGYKGTQDELARSREKGYVTNPEIYVKEASGVAKFGHKVLFGLRVLFNPARLIGLVIGGINTFFHGLSQTKYFDKKVNESKGWKKKLWTVASKTWLVVNFLMITKIHFFTQVIHAVWNVTGGQLAKTIDSCFDYAQYGDGHKSDEDRKPMWKRVGMAFAGVVLGASSLFFTLAPYLAPAVLKSAPVISWIVNKFQALGGWLHSSVLNSAGLSKGDSVIRAVGLFTFKAVGLAIQATAKFTWGFFVTAPIMKVINWVSGADKKFEGKIKGVEKGFNHAKTDTVEYSSDSDIPDPDPLHAPRGRGNLCQSLVGGAAGMKPIPVADSSRLSMPPANCVNPMIVAQRVEAINIIRALGRGQGEELVATAPPDTVQPSPVPVVVKLPVAGSNPGGGIVRANRAQRSAWFGRQARARAIKRGDPLTGGTVPPTQLLGQPAAAASKQSSQMSPSTATVLRGLHAQRVDSAGAEESFLSHVSDSD